MPEIKIKHLKQSGALATFCVGVAFVWLGWILLQKAFGGSDGPIFLGFMGVASCVIALFLVSAPWRLVTRLDDKGVSIGWMLGNRHIPCGVISSFVVGPLGTGKERDPTSIAIHLASGEEVLLETLGRIPPEKHPSVAKVTAWAADKGIKVHNILAPLEERQQRERAWRELRQKGHR